MTVYLICLDRPLNPERPARHYLGFTEDDSLAERMNAHAAGNGSNFMGWVGRRGIGWELVRTWVGGTRALERYIKKTWRNSRYLCPRCNKTAHRYAMTIRGSYTTPWGETYEVEWSAKELILPMTYRVEGKEA